MMTEFGQIYVSLVNGKAVVRVADNDVLVSDELLHSMELEPGDNLAVGEYVYRHVSEHSPGVHWYSRLKKDQVQPTAPGCQHPCCIHPPRRI
jgi:hypothetical protein